MYSIDTHIHLQDFNGDFAPKLLGDENTLGLIVVSAKSDDFENVAKWIDKGESKVIGAFGLHPWYIGDDFEFDRLEEFLVKYPKSLVGEIGLDGIRQNVSFSQRMFFREQLFIAKKYDRPVVVHGAKAFEALKEYKKELKEVKFVYHGFTKNREIIKFVNDVDGYFGLGRMFLKQKDARDMLSDMPINRILFETDAPFQIKEENYFLDRESCLENLIKLVDNYSGCLGEQLIKNTLEFVKC